MLFNKTNIALVLNKVFRTPKTNTANPACVPCFLPTTEKEQEQLSWQIGLCLWQKDYYGQQVVAKHEILGTS